MVHILQSFRLRLARAYYSCQVCQGAVSSRLTQQKNCLRFGVRRNVARIFDIELSFPSSRRQPIMADSTSKADDVFSVHVIGNRSFLVYSQYSLSRFRWRASGKAAGHPHKQFDIALTTVSCHDRSSFCLFM
jgi:hypothetical protein